MKVINRKNILIKADLSDGVVFSRNIHMNFQPDTLNVNQITFCGDPEPVNKYFGVSDLFCNTLNESLGSFHDGCSVSPNISLSIKNVSINTQWQFTVMNYANNVSQVFVDGDLFVHLEFLEHEK